jgi:ABC-2 type transport system permease protein
VLLPAACSIFLLDAMCPGITRRDVDLGAILGGGLILVLVSAFLLAMGLLISLTSRNQIAAAISTLSLIWFVLMAGWLMSLVPGSSRHVTDYFSVTRHVTDFSQGMVDLRPVILYLSGTGFLLFVAVRLLESDRWK